MPNNETVAKASSLTEILDQKRWIAILDRFIADVAKILHVLIFFFIGHCCTEKRRQFHSFFGDI